MTAALGAVDAQGWITGVRRLLSPNHDERPEGAAVELIVVHNISLPPEQFGGPGVEQLFSNTLDPGEHPYYATIADLRVSAHVFIRRDGEVIQFVPLGARAWHAGSSEWDGRSRCNDFSVGIELEGSDTQPFTTAQYGQLVRVIATIRARYPIRAIAGHSDIAPGRKTDPGPCFDWSALAQALDAPPPGQDTQVSYAGISLRHRSDV